MQTGENEQGLRKIIDLTRMMAIAVLIIHFYYCCYASFKQWQLTSTITDKLLQNIYSTVTMSSAENALFNIRSFGRTCNKETKLVLSNIYFFTTRMKGRNNILSSWCKTS